MTHEQKEYNDIVASIYAIQDNEKNLYSRLELLMKSPQYDKNEKQQIIDNIKNLQTTRNTLYDILKQKHKKPDTNEIEMIDFMNREISNMEHNLSTLEAYKQQQYRLITDKNYKRNVYLGQINILKITILILGILIVNEILRILIIPNIVSLTLRYLTIVLGGAYIAYQAYDMNLRNNFYYEKYEWNVKPELIKGV